MQWCSTADFAWQEWKTNTSDARQCPDCKCGQINIISVDRWLCADKIFGISQRFTHLMNVRQLNCKIIQPVATDTQQWMQQQTFQTRQSCCVDIYLDRLQQLPEQPLFCLDATDAGRLLVLVAQWQTQLPPLSTEHLNKSFCCSSAGTRCTAQLPLEYATIHNSSEQIWSY